MVIMVMNVEIALHWFAVTDVTSQPFQRLTTNVRLVLPYQTVITSCLHDFQSIIITESRRDHESECIRVVLSFIVLSTLTYKMKSGQSA